MDIAQYLELHGIRVERAGGRYLRACCPFHNEKTPSFYIDTNDDHGYCHGGCPENRSYFRDVIEVIYRYEFPNDPTRKNAFDRARELGCVIKSDMDFTPRPARVLPDPTPEQRRALTIAFSFYQEMFQHKRAGDIARDYLFGYRKLSGPLLELSLQTVGFAPDSAYFHTQLIDRLRKAFGNNWINIATVSSLLSRRGGAFFRDRIVFAVKNSKGEVIFLQGRSIDPAIDKNYRFLNSNGIRKVPYTPIPYEAALYQGTCVDEGPTDAIAHGANGFYAYGLFQAKVPGLPVLRALPHPIIGGLDNAPSELEAGPMNQALLAKLCHDNGIPFIDGSAPDHIKDTSKWLELHGPERFRQEMAARLQLVAA